VAVVDDVVAVVAVVEDVVEWFTFVVLLGARGSGRDGPGPAFEGFLAVKVKYSLMSVVFCFFCGGGSHVSVGKGAVV